MSAYGRFNTQLRDVELIDAACKELGLTITVRKPETEAEYDGRRYRQHNADITIHANHSAGLYTDIALNKSADGTYTAGMDEDYRGYLNRLNQEYGIADKIKLMTKRGRVFQGRTVQQTEKGPRVQLHFVKR